VCLVPGAAVGSGTGLTPERRRAPRGGAESVRILSGDVAGYSFSPPLLLDVDIRGLGIHRRSDPPRLRVSPKGLLIVAGGM
jgi:hypothetical protein